MTTLRNIPGANLQNTSATGSGEIGGANGAKAPGSSQTRVSVGKPQDNPMGQVSLKGLPTVLMTAAKQLPALAGALNLPGSGRPMPMSNGSPLRAMVMNSASKAIGKRSPEYLAKHAALVADLTAVLLKSKGDESQIPTEHLR